MALPSLIAQLADQLLTEFCARRVPTHLHDRLRLSFTVKGNNVTLVELRPFFLDATAPWTESKIAVFKYDAVTRTWELFARDRNGRRMPYDADPAADLASLIAKVDADPTGIFWG